MLHRLFRLGQRFGKPVSELPTHIYNKFTNKLTPNYYGIQTVQSEMESDISSGEEAYHQAAINTPASQTSSKSRYHRPSQLASKTNERDSSTE